MNNNTFTDIKPTQVEDTMSTEKLLELLELEGSLDVDVDELANSVYEILANATIDELVEYILAVQREDPDDSLSLRESFGVMLDFHLAESTNETINAVVTAAKSAGLWTRKLRKKVDKRNVALAQELETAGLGDIKRILETLAPSGEYIPGAWYHGALQRLETLAAEAAGLLELDEVARTMKQWHMGQGLQAVKQKDKELGREWGERLKNGGVKMRKDTTRRLVDGSENQVRQMIRAGWEVY